MPSSPRFHLDRPSGPQTVPPWHPLAHIARTLPAAVERLTPLLGVGAGDRVLDFGCADAPYHRFFVPGAEIVAADLAGNPRADLELRDDGTVPIGDATFDAVLSTQVLEHVTDPALYLAECHRVLRPGGRLLLTTHGTMVFHPDPVDLWRWTSQGLRRVVEEAGFAVECFEGLVGLAATGLQLLQEAVMRGTHPRLRPPVGRLGQALMGVAERRTTAASRRTDALVFALVAVRA